MKTILMIAIICAATFSLAVEPPTIPETNIIEPNQAPMGEGDIVGTIQEPAAKNKKIIKKIMSRKKKPKAEETMKSSTTTTPDPTEVKK